MEEKEREGKILSLSLSYSIFAPTPPLSYFYPFPYNPLSLLTPFSSSICKQDLK